MADEEDQNFSFADDFIQIISIMTFLGDNLGIGNIFCSMRTDDIDICRKWFFKFYGLKSFKRMFF